MMSLKPLANAIIGPKPKQPVQSFDIERLLAEAEAALPELEASHRALAFDAVVDETPDAAAQLDQSLAALAAHRTRIEHLRAALVEARKRDAAASAERSAAVRASQVAAVRAHLQRRDVAAATFAKKQAEAIEAWRDMVKHSEAAAAACPIGVSWPPVAMTTFGELAAATRGELFRVGGDPALGSPRSFPGGHAPSHDFVNRPDAIKPLAEQIRASTEITMAHLKAAALPSEPTPAPAWTPRSIAPEATPEQVSERPPKVTLMAPRPREPAEAMDTM